MDTLGLLLLLHVLVIGSFVVARMLHTKLAPVPKPSGGLVAAALPPCEPLTLLTGLQVEAYARTGLVDLRILLIQAARRRD